MQKVTFQTIIIFLAIASAIVACANQTPSFKEDPTEKVYDLTGFSKIGLGMHANVYYEQKAEYGVKVVAKESVIEKITVEVSNNELKIHHKGHGLTNTGRIDIYISCPNIEGFKISGSGKIIADKPIESTDLEIKVSGSGDVHLNGLKADHAKFHISGSGNVIIEGDGNINGAEMHISGSGDVKAESIKIKELTGKISGSGNGKFFVTEKLNAKISGSGDMYYRGKPVVDVEVSGSGKIKPL